MGGSAVGAAVLGRKRIGNIPAHFFGAILPKWRWPGPEGGLVMHLNTALEQSASARCKDEWAPKGSVSHIRILALDAAALDRAAEALFDFVFASCAGRHRWTDCEEKTKDGFRREALAVIEAVWPKPEDSNLKPV